MWQRSKNKIMNARRDRPRKRYTWHLVFRANSAVCGLVALDGETFDKPPEGERVCMKCEARRGEEDAIDRRRYEHLKAKYGPLSVR